MAKVELGKKTFRNLEGAMWSFQLLPEDVNYVMHIMHFFLLERKVFRAQKSFRYE